MAWPLVARLGAYFLSLAHGVAHRPDHRRASAPLRSAHLPIVSDQNGVFNWGAPDDQRYFNGGVDRWARKGTLSLIQKQQWGSLVLNRHAERGPERSGCTPDDFVAEAAEAAVAATEYRRTAPARCAASSSSYASSSCAGSWVGTPAARAKLKLDASNEYRVSLRDRGKRSESEQRGWFPEMEIELTKEWDERQERGWRITEFWMRSRARRLVRKLYPIAHALHERRGSSRRRTAGGCVVPTHSICKWFGPLHKLLNNLHLWQIACDSGATFDKLLVCQSVDTHYGSSALFAGGQTSKRRISWTTCRESSCTGCGSRPRRTRAATPPANQSFLATASGIRSAKKSGSGAPRPRRTGSTRTKSRSRHSAVGTPLGQRRARTRYGSPRELASLTRSGAARTMRCEYTSNLSLRVRSRSSPVAASAPRPWSTPMWSSSRLRPPRSS